jgi:IclR family transcriptional regulator, acetate operon repressor
VLLRFAGRGWAGLDLAEASATALDALSERTGETINLGVAAPLGVEHLAQRDSRHFLGGTSWIGRRVPYHCTANGKVLLAFGAGRLPDGELERLAPRTITDRDALETELEEARRRGYATAVDELEPGLAAVAAPVYAGDTVAALSVSGPTLRMPAARLGELAVLLTDQAAELSAALAPDDTKAGAA